MSYDCRNCGASIKNNVSKCNYCGVSLPIKDHQDPKQNEVSSFPEKFVEKEIVSENETETKTEKKSELIQDSQKKDPKIFFKCRCSSCNSKISFDSDDALSNYSWDGVSYWVISCPVCGEILDVDKNNAIRVKPKESPKRNSSSSFLFYYASKLLDLISKLFIGAIWVGIVIAFWIWLKVIFSPEISEKKDIVDGSHLNNTNNYFENSIRHVSFKICNETADDIMLAVIDWDDFNEDWYTSGWSEVKSNACSIIRNSRSDKGVYWYAKNSSMSNPIVWEGDVKSCVSADSFKNKHKNYEPCGSDQKEVGFKYIDLSNTTDTFEQKLILEKSSIEKNYLEIPEEKIDKENYVNPSEITDGYSFGSKIHMNGGNNYRKSYDGFILNIKPEKEDLLVLNEKYEDVLPMYLSKAGEGDIDASHNLGLMYIRGLGVNKNLAKGIRFLEISANYRNWDADSVQLEKARKLLKNTKH